MYQNYTVDFQYMCLHTDIYHHPIQNWLSRTLAYYFQLSGRHHKVWATLGSKLCHMENNGLVRCLNANMNGHLVIAMWRISRRFSALSCNAVQLCVIYTCTWHWHSSNNCRFFLCICYEKHEPAQVIPLMTLAKLLKPRHGTIKGGR